MGAGAGAAAAAAGTGKVGSSGHNQFTPGVVPTRDLERPGLPGDPGQEDGQASQSPASQNQRATASGGGTQPGPGTPA